MLYVFHADLMERLSLYLVVGGMPEVVSSLADALPAIDSDALQSMQAAINDAYRADFSRHEASMPRGLPARLNQVWDPMPGQLARENKRFLYGAVRSGARGRDFELAIQWLQDMSLALKAPKANPPQYLLAINTSPDLYDYRKALIAATSGTVRLGSRIRAGHWEFILGKRKSDEHPVVKHALFSGLN